MIGLKMKLCRGTAMLPEMARVVKAKGFEESGS